MHDIFLLGESKIYDKVVLEENLEQIYDKTLIC